MAAAVLKHGYYSEYVRDVDSDHRGLEEVPLLCELPWCDIIMLLNILLFQKTPIYMLNIPCHCHRLPVQYMLIVLNSSSVNGVTANKPVMQGKYFIIFMRKCFRA